MSTELGVDAGLVETERARGEKGHLVGGRGGRSTRGSWLTVVDHVGLNEMVSSESGDEGELTSEDGTTDNHGKLTRVITRGGILTLGSTTAATDLETARLSRKMSTTTNSTDLDGRHGDRDMETLLLIVRIDWLHDGDTVGGTDVLGRILTGGEVDGS